MLIGYSHAQSDTEYITAFYEKQKVLFGHFIGKQYIDFDLIISDSLSLSNTDLTNKVVFINFWAENCSPCIAEIEGLNQLYSTLIKTPNFLFVSFSYDPDSTITRLVEKYNIKYKVYQLDLKDYSRLSYKNGIPTSIILNRDGIIKYFSSGGPGEKDKATKYIMTIIYPKILQLIEKK